MRNQHDFLYRKVRLSTKCDVILTFWVFDSSLEDLLVDLRKVFAQVRFQISRSRSTQFFMGYPKPGLDVWRLLIQVNFFAKYSRKSLCDHIEFPTSEVSTWLTVSDETVSSELFCREFIFLSFEMSTSSNGWTFAEKSRKHEGRLISVRNKPLLSEVFRVVPITFDWPYRESSYFQHKIFRSWPIEWHYNHSNLKNVKGVLYGEEGGGLADPLLKLIFQETH